MKVLFSHGADPHQLFYGRSLLSLLYDEERVNLEAVQTLLEIVPYWDIDSILVHYCKRNPIDVDAIEILIGKKKDIFKNNSEIGEKAITAVYQYSANPSAIEYLISQGAYPNQDIIENAKEYDKTIYRIFKNCGYAN